MASLYYERNNKGKGKGGGMINILLTNVHPRHAAKRLMQAKLAALKRGYSHVELRNSVYLPHAKVLIINVQGAWYSQITARIAEQDIQPRTMNKPSDFNPSDFKPKDYDTVVA